MNTNSAHAYLKNTVLVSATTFMSEVFIFLFRYLIRKQEFAHIPKPDYFFTPLYRNHGGNFKVKDQPVTFSDRSVISKQAQQALP